MTSLFDRITFPDSNQNQDKPANPFASAGSTQPASQSGLTTSTSQSGGGLFGSSTTSSAPPSGGLFGSTATSQPQQSGGGLFGSSTSQSQQQSGGSGLFGSTSNTSQPQQSGSSLFGSTTTSQPQQTGSNLFGSPQNASQPQQSGGLFGSAPAATSQPQTGSGLFGSSSATSGQQQGSSGNSLFGNLQSSQPQQTPSSSFGNTTNQNQNQSGSSLFGGNTQNQQNDQQKPSLFGGLGGSSTNNQQQRPSLFSNTSSQQPQRQSTFGGPLRPGGLTMGQSSNQQQQQTVPGVKIDVSNLRGTTRFNDLHEELQNQIEQIDSFIQQQIAFKEQCDALMPSHENSLSSIPGDVEYVQNQLETCELSVENDSSEVSQVKSIVQNDAKDARLSFRAVENLKLPPQYHYSGVWQNITPPRRGLDSAADSAPTDLLSFFDKSSSRLSSTMQAYQSNLSEIENHLGTVEANTAMQAQQIMFKRGREGGARSRDDQINELREVLRQFEGGIVNVAERIGKVKENVVDIVEGGTGSSSGWRRR